MKIVIQNPQDLSFLTVTRRWSPDFRDAMVFDNFRIAVEFCTRHKLGDVQIVLRSEEDSVDMSVPVENRGTSAAVLSPAQAPA